MIYEGDDDGDGGNVLAYGVLFASIMMAKMTVNKYRSFSQCVVNGERADGDVLMIVMCW